MIRVFFFFVIYVVSMFPSFAQFGDDARWISTMESQSSANTWLGYRKTFVLTTIPAVAEANLAVDSKYWLWINGELVVFEGGLKRGPNPSDTYYDKIDLTRYLMVGENSVAILVWYFGKDGFSHKSSGRAGLIFDSNFGLSSNDTWRCAVAKAFETAGEPYPNFRLSESSIKYDARKDWGDWFLREYDDGWMPKAQELGVAGSYPWNDLIVRPIPLWKNSGIQEYASQQQFPMISKGDTIAFDLSYNMHITPYLEIEAEAGKSISIFTDNYLFFNGSEPNLRAEYITRDGRQTHESLGWMNGHQVFYVIPEGVKVLSLGYRETGYQTDFSGSFESSDPFFDRLWQKSLRTLYVTMRDSYMDCPERERAQWTGDAVNQVGETFYALSTSSHALARKWLRELVAWQKHDGTIYAPVPAGNWVGELPCQSTASIGYFGLWTYYMHTGDKSLLAELYPGVKRYLALWDDAGNGLVHLRNGDWTWGDWGDNRDMLLIYNLWYYLGLKGMHASALALKNGADATDFAMRMERFEKAFNERYWNGTAYRDPAYVGETDDRVQALAVVAGIAEKDKYPAILRVFESEEHASPYMEKYVFEAMFQMGYEREALARHKRRYGPMVDDLRFTTLYEGWGIGEDGYGGGTVNHSWSGGGLTVLSQYVCGVAPLEPGYKTFQIIPQPANIQRAKAVVPSVVGEIQSAYRLEDNRFILEASVPEGTRAVLGVPDGYRSVSVNGVVVYRRGKFMANAFAEQPAGLARDGYRLFTVSQGVWVVEAVK